MDSRTQSWIDQDEAWMADTIRRRGRAIQYVGGEECSRPGCECPAAAPEKQPRPGTFTAWTD